MPRGLAGAQEHSRSCMSSGLTALAAQSKSRAASHSTPVIHPTPSPSVAIIGAGLSGALCAQQLSQAGWRVEVFDKSRGVGGRMATRRVGFMGPDGVDQVALFDHGAPAFDWPESSPVGKSWLHHARAAGVIAPWVTSVPSDEPAGSMAWVPTPDMPALCRWLLQGQVVKTLCTIDGLQRSGRGWSLTPSGQTAGEGFDAMVVAIPPAQAALLLSPHRSDWAQQAQHQSMSPCWTLMAVSDAPEGPEGNRPGQAPMAASPYPHPFASAAASSQSPLAMVIRQDTKPGRSGLPRGMASWVAHASQSWTQAHLEEAPEAILPLLQAALQEALGAELRWHHAAVHRWRYAQFEGAAQATQCLWDQDLALGVCGDAWGGGGVWGASESALALCAMMLRR